MFRKFLNGGRKEKKVVLGNNSLSDVREVGSVLLNVRTGVGTSAEAILENVLLVPDLRKNLLSVTSLLANGINVSFSFNDMSCKLIKNERTIGLAHLKNGLWVLDTIPDSKIFERRKKNESAVAFIAAPANSIERWHLRFNHLNQDDIKRMSEKEMVRGMIIEKETKERDRCVGCVLGKHAREKLVPVLERRETDLLELVHTDLCGPMDTETMQTRKKYILTFIDDKSRRSWVYLLSKKSDVFYNFKLWKAMVERQTRKNVMILRSDAGGEYIDSEMKQWCSEQGILQEFTQTDTPQQNGVAERFNRTLMEAVRAMLYGAGLSKGFWGEAVLCANHTRNRSPSRSINENKTPFEMFTGRKPTVFHLRTFGCPAYVHIIDSKRKKLDAKSWPGIFVGYSLEKKGWRIWDKHRGKIIDSRDVVFYENFIMRKNKIVHDTNENQPMKESEKESEVHLELSPTKVIDLDSSAKVQNESTPTVPIDKEVSIGIPADNVNTKVSDTNHIIGNNDSDVIERFTFQKDETIPLPDTMVDSEQIGVTTEHIESAEEEEEREEKLEEYSASESSDQKKEVSDVRRSHRLRKPPQTLEYDRMGSPNIQNLYASCNYAMQVEPQSYLEAIESVDKDSWLEAIRKETESIIKHGTFSLVDLPKGRTPISSKWVFKLKELKDGDYKFKARLVARGFSQKEGIDYTETFAPVVKYKSLRILLAIACERNMHIHQMDVCTAFLHGELEEEIYMTPPEGLQKEGKVWRLLKTLYGLKQAPRCWNQRLDVFFAQKGYVRNENDFATYMKGSGREQLLIAIYVDDLLIMSEDLDAVNKTKAELTAEFEMVDFGEAQLVLGMQIKHYRKMGVLTMSQERYCEKVLTRFNMKECKAVSTPLALGQKLRLTNQQLTEKEVKDMENVPYRSAIGSLMYLMVSTRPDLAASVGILSRYLEDPNPSHWEAVKRVFRYVQGSKDYGLTFTRQGNNNPVGYCDADWGGCLDTRRSTTGYVFLMGGGAISWSSKRQSSVALSSCEAEYMAASQAGKEVVWLSNFLTELNVKITKPLEVYSDSQSALALMRNPVYHERSKHIDMKYHYVREQARQKNIKFLYVQTEHQVADVLTKAVSKEKLFFCRKQMGVCPISKNFEILSQ